MNHREPPLSPADTFGKRLGLLPGLLLALATSGAQAQTRSYSIALVVPPSEAVPYLRVTGAPPLRFQEAALPLHPAPSAPEPVAPVSPATAPSDPAPATEGEARLDTVPATEQAMPASPATPALPATDVDAPPAKTPAPILPDESRPAIRPEDFLPYFQIPGSARTPADVTLLVPAPKAAPAPGPLPPSSATYTQSPP